jgi:hypothetical protein
MALPPRFGRPIPRALAPLRAHVGRHRSRAQVAVEGGNLRAEEFFTEVRFGTYRTTRGGALRSKYPTGCMRSANLTPTRRQNDPTCEPTFAFDVAIDVRNWLRRSKLRGRNLFQLASVKCR